MVVSPQMEADLPARLIVRDGEAAFHRLPHAIHHLIDHRLVEANLWTTFDRQHQIAVDGQSRLCAIKTQLNRRGIRAGRHHEVVLQLSAMPVIQQVYARVDALHMNLAVHRHIMLPLGRVVSSKVVGLAALRVLACRLLDILRPKQTHPNYRRADAGLELLWVGRVALGRRNLVDLQDCVRTGEVERILGSSRKPLNVGGRLPAIWLKTQGKLAVMDHGLC